MGKIFINYRRGDDFAFACRLFDRLEDKFHPEQLIMDVDNIAPGLNFVEVLEEQVDQFECSQMSIESSLIYRFTAVGQCYRTLGYPKETFWNNDSKSHIYYCTSIDRTDL